MPRFRSIPLSTVIVLFLLCLRALAANDQPRWLEFHSTHFIVITDAGEKQGRQTALRFEQMRAVFGDVLTKDRLHQSIPLTIVALQNDRAYFQLAPLHNGQPIDRPGFLVPGEDQDFIVLNLSEPESWRAVSYDFARMLLTYNYPPAQPWFDEGVSEYFSSVRIDDKQIEIGADPMCNDSSAKAASLPCSQVLASKPWIPLADLLARKTQLDDPVFKAESWAVLHYFLHEKYLPATGTYFGLVLNQHLPEEDAIKQAYGVSSAELEKAVRDYFQSEIVSSSAKGAQHSAVPVSLEDSAILPKPLPEADAQAIYAGIQTRIPERRDLGLNTLQKLATTATQADLKNEKRTKRTGEDEEEQLPSNAMGNAVAHRMLAWDEIQHGNYDAAFRQISDAAALNRTDMWVRYYLCIAKYRMAQAKHTDIQGLANMLLDLRSVLEWYPEMADAYDLLGTGRNAGGGITAAMQAERAAISLSPRNELYLYHLAQIYVSSKKWEAADALLQRLKLSSDSQIAAMAQDLLTESGAERKYGIAAKSASARPAYEAQKSPFDVLEEDAAKRESAEKAPEPGSGDKREAKYIKGRLVSVDCSKAPVAILTVDAAAGVLKLRTVDYRSLVLMGTDNFSCDWRDREVTVNYKPSNANAGDLISLELR